MTIPRSTQRRGLSWLVLIRKRDWRYHLSRLVPIPMRTTYRVSNGGPWRAESARWVQWRGRIMRHHVTPA